MTTVLEKIVGFRQNQVQEAISSYAALVESVAEGQNIDPAQAVDVLESASKTDSDLTADVAWYRERTKRVEELNNLRSRVEKLPKLAKQLQAAEQKFAQVKAQVKADYENKCKPIQKEINRIHSAQSRIGDLEGFLINTCRDVELLKQRNDLRETTTLLASSNAALEQKINQDDANLNGLMNERSRLSPNAELRMSPGSTLKSRRCKRRLMKAADDSVRCRTN